MAFSLPNPTVPTNGQPGNAIPILENELALAQAIASFDGSQIQAGSVTEAAFANAVNPRLRSSEMMANFVFSGCTWSLVSGFSGTMTGGTIYVNGYRVVVAGVGANTFAASSDTYVDIDYLGNVTYQAVANGANAPTITANAIRVAKIITSGAAITSVVQSGSDSASNIIYPIGSASAAKLQNPYKFSVYLSTFQTGIADATVTKVAFNAEKFDTNNNFNTTTNTYTVPVTGFYQINVYLQVQSAANQGVSNLIYLAKNAASIQEGGRLYPTTGAGNSTDMFGNISTIIQLVAGDLLTVLVNMDVSSGTVTVQGGATVSSFSGFLVSVV